MFLFPKRIDIFGADDKRQISGVFAGTLTRDFLPPQIKYKGKTAKCHPMVPFPVNWQVTYTPNHWANDKITEDYIKKILVPYIEEKRASYGIDSSALVMFDQFRGQCTPHIMLLL